MSKVVKPMTSANLMFVASDLSKVPKFLEPTGSDYVYFGEKNDYPEYLIKIFNRSAKHNAIITGKVNYICGKGWGQDGEPIEEEIPLNQAGETANDILLKSSTDFELFNAFALQIIWSKDSKKVAEIYHIDIASLRISKDGKTFFYTEEWFKPNGERCYQPENNEDWRTFPAFDPMFPGGSQILYYKAYRPKLRVYPLPDYIGAIPYIECDMEIANYHLSNIKQGMVAGTMINFYNGVPTEEEQKKISQKFNSKFTGTDQAGSVIFNFSDDKNRGAEVLPLRSNELDKQFAQLNDQVLQEIFTGHKVTSPMLFGIRTSGQLGGRTEILEANELFKNNYITPRQQEIEKVYNMVFGLMGTKETFTIIPLDPVSLISPTEILKVMTKDEIRAMAGLPELTPEQKEEMNPKPMGPQQMKSDEEKRIISRFKKKGKLRSEYQVVKMSHDRKEEMSFIKDYFDDLKLSDLEKSILDLLMKDKMTTIPSMAIALKVDQPKIIEAIESLEKQKLLIAHDNAVVPTKKGEKVVDRDPPKINLFVMYSYEELPNLPPLKTESRPFCQELLSLDRLYSREDIEEIGNEFGTDVWLYRGGFYHNPEDDITTPYCRHVWHQNVVQKKA